MTTYRPIPPWERNAEAKIAQRSHIQDKPSYAVKQDYLQVAEHPPGDVQMQGKFGRGFVRRQYDSILQDLPRKELEKKHELRKERGFQAHQRRLAEWNSYNGYNPISGEFDAAKVARYEGKKHIAFELSRLAIKEQSASQGTKVYDPDRVRLLNAEGLVVTKKNGSVAETIRHSGDGYDQRPRTTIDGSSFTTTTRTTSSVLSTQPWGYTQSMDITSRTRVPTLQLPKLA
jgi:hypothetical protein